MIKTVSFIFVLLLSLSNTALANSIYLQTSLYTKHFSPDPDHDDHQHLLGLEWYYKKDDLLGISHFDNSFGQPTTYLYRGWVFPYNNFQFKLTAGLIHGYKGEYKDKIPLNQLGTAPAIIPSVGYHAGPVGADVILFGFAGIMVNIGYSFNL